MRMILSNETKISLIQWFRGVDNLKIQIVGSKVYPITIKVKTTLVNN